MESDDERICRKFEITRDDPWFETAKSLDRNRPDRTIADLPMYLCPHCAQESQKDDYCDVKAGDTWECPKCERPIHVTFVDHIIQAHLCTHPTEADT